MSFFDDASLVFLPSGQAGKDGKAYSMKPTDGSGDFTFSRGSNLTATRIDSNGLIEKGRENLLKQSNNFGDTSAWTQSQTTRSSGQGGYDGSSDAWEIVRASGGALALYQMITNNSGVNTALSGVNTFSIYVKVNSSNGIGLAFAATSVMAQFNISDALQTGAVVENGIIASTQEYVGNNFYRLSVTANTTASNVRLYTLAASGTSTTSSGATYIVQDAQVELGLVATEYIESGATTGLAGILEDSPRFDYSGGASCPSLILEGSRTNKIKYSEYINTTAFNLTTNLTINNNQATSPEGANNAAKIIATTDNSRHELRTSSATKNGTDMVSCFVKANGYNYVQIASWASGSNYVNFDLTDGSLGSVGASPPSNYGIEDYGNGWYRIYANVTASGGGIIGIGIITSASAGWAESFTGNGTDGLLIWGAQLEVGSYPTSYIPNHSGGSVTMNADVNTLLNQSGVIGQTAGTILFDAYFDESEKVNFSISDSSVSNFISIETTSSNEVTAKVEQGGSTQATITTTTSFFAEGDRLKCAIAYDDRDMAFYINGTQVNTAAPNLIPACDDVRFGNYDGSIKADQRVNRVLLFTTRISDNNLATLTS